MENALDRTTAMSGSLTGTGSANPANAQVESAAQAAHRTTDEIADKAWSELKRNQGEGRAAPRIVMEG
jgi:hypothetical protein